ncbi:MAG: sensor histidine kinase [bacterium]|nr:sensor histidine kinase [bacterium]
MKLNIENFKESNEFLNDLYENVTSAIFLADDNAYIYNFNDAFQALFYKPEDKILKNLCGNVMGCVFHVNSGKNCGETEHCRDCVLRNNIIKSFIEKVPIYKNLLFREFYIEGHLIKKYFIFTTRYIEYKGKGMILVIVDDITELEEQKQELEKYNQSLSRMIAEKTVELCALSAQYAEEVREKNSLMSELDHRIGNTLQIVTSLINLQCQNEENETASEQLRDMENRIHVLKYLYQQLHYTGSMAHVKMDQYLQAVLSGFAGIYSLETENIKINMDIDNIDFSIDEAMPLGLITNEIVSNSIKHAFPGRNGGGIFIGLKAHTRDSYSLIIRDNGIGINKDIDPENSKTLGLSLVVILAKQLKGIIQFSMADGTLFQIDFSVK